MGSIQALEQEKEISSFSLWSTVLSEKTFLSQCCQRLDSDGVLRMTRLFEVPQKLKEVVFSVVNSNEWRPFLSPFLSVKRFPSPAEYRDWLKDLHCQVKEMRVAWEAQVFSIGDWNQFLLEVFPFLDKLPEGKKQACLEEITHRFFCEDQECSEFSVHLRKIFFESRKL